MKTAGDLPFLRLNSLSQNLTVLPAPSGREPLAWREALRLNRDVGTIGNALRYALRINSGIRFFIRDSEKPVGFSESPFHRRGRGGKRQVQRRFLRKRGAAGERSLPLGGAVAQRLRGYGWRSEKSVKAIAPTGAALAFLCFDFFFGIVKGEQPLTTGCGSQHPLRALDGTRVLLAAAPTTAPCFRRWRRSQLLHCGVGGVQR